jgi:Tfp pilus assembly protein PilW
MNRVTGLTLVEVLVALVLVLAVFAGSLAFVARGREAQRVGESLARLVEQIDAALVVLVEEIRMGNAYHGNHPFLQAFTEQIDNAVLRGHELNITSGHNHHIIDQLRYNV